MVACLRVHTDRCEQCLGQGSNLDQPEVHPRVARYRAQRYRDLLCHLNLAKSAAAQLGIDVDGLEQMINAHLSEWDRVTSRAGERIEPRKRPKRPTLSHEAPEEFYLFLDECGSHVPGTKDGAFPVFALCGVVVPARDYEAFDLRWKTWKLDNLGSQDALVHEPDVRKRTSMFRGTSRENAEEIQASLENILSDLEFTCIASVVDLRAFAERHPNQIVDDFLPASCYLMSIDFVLERFLHYLQSKGGFGRGLVVAESRGSKEDATVHAEFIRLHLEGTQFIPDGSFRYHLRPYIEFLRKGRNNSGLQIADLAARPIAEKVLNPAGSPMRWSAFEPKLYDGGNSEPHKYGLKIFPIHDGNDPFPHLPSKAKGSA